MVHCEFGAFLCAKNVCDVCIAALNHVCTRKGCTVCGDPLPDSDVCGDPLPDQIGIWISDVCGDPLPDSDVCGDPLPDQIGMCGVTLYQIGMCVVTL